VTFWSWSHMTGAQRKEAVSQQASCGNNGYPPSGPLSVLWVFDDAGHWSWASAIWPADVERGGIEISRPADAAAARPATKRKGTR
jgi:hypothetical protein